MNWPDEDLFVYANYDLTLTTSILNQDADAAFVACLTLYLHQAPQYFWRFCTSFLLEAWKAERSFSFTNRIHHRLCNTISTDLLRAFSVVANSWPLGSSFKNNIWTPIPTGWWHFSFSIGASFIRYLHLV